jgi:hypothetical protein
MTAIDLQLHVARDPDRDARAIVRAHPQMGLNRRSKWLAGALLVLSGALVAASSPVVGGAFVLAGLFILVGGLRHLQTRAIRRALSGAAQTDWPLTIDVSDRGIRWTTARSSIEHTWSVFERAVEDHDGLLLLHGRNRQWSWIPRRGCDEWRWHELTGLVIEKTGALQTATP